MSTTPEISRHANLIRTRLRTAPASGELATPLDITGVEVLVYEQQKGIKGRVAAEIAKPGACCMTIAYEGFTATDPNAARPRLAHRYNLTVWSKTELDKDGDLPAVAVLESVILRLWQWVPGGGHAMGEALVTDGGLVPDASYLKLDCEITIPIYH